VPAAAELAEIQREFHIVETVIGALEQAQVFHLEDVSFREPGGVAVQTPEWLVASPLAITLVAPVERYGWFLDHLLRQREDHLFALVEREHFEKLEPGEPLAASGAMRIRLELLVLDEAGS